MGPVLDSVLDGTFITDEDDEDAVVGDVGGSIWTSEGPRRWKGLFRDVVSAAVNRGSWKAVDS